MDRIDKLSWQWSAGQAGKDLTPTPSRLSPPESNRVWQVMLERICPRILLALRNRSMAYRKAGVASKVCHEAALSDLVGPRVDSRVSTRIPAPRKA